LRGGEAAHNAEIARGVLSGQSGPVRQTVLLNAAAAIVAADGDPLAVDGDLTARLRAGIDRAANAIDSGVAAALLDRWVAATGR
jgi:anthranilate phosphoribosyltransferase